MDRAISMLAGMGLGAGLMYMLDPQQGRRRRAMAQDKLIRAGHQACEAADVVGRDMRNRLHGLASGDMSVLVGGKRALEHPFQGAWSPTGRTMLGALGLCMLGFGMTCRAPAACILGTLGLAMIGEGATNAGVSDIKKAAGDVTQWAKQSAGNLGMNLSTNHRGAGQRRETARV